MPLCRVLNCDIVTSLDSSGLHTFSVYNLAPLRITLVFNPVIPPLLVLYLLPLAPHHCLLLLAALLCHLFPLPLTPSGFFNRMLAVCIASVEPGALYCFTFFRPISLTLYVSRNPILTHLPLSGFLDYLFCVLIAPTFGLTFSLAMPLALAAESSLLSGRAYSFMNFLPPLFLRLIPTLIM